MNTVQALVGAALAATLASLAGVYMYRSSEFLGQTMSFSFVFSASRAGIILWTVILSVISTAVGSFFWFRKAVGGRRTVRKRRERLVSERAGRVAEGGATAGEVGEEEEEEEEEGAAELLLDDESPLPPPSGEAVEGAAAGEGGGAAPRGSDDTATGAAAAATAAAAAAAAAAARASSAGPAGDVSRRHVGSLGLHELVDSFWHGLAEGEGAPAPLTKEAAEEQGGAAPQMRVEFLYAASTKFIGCLSAADFAALYERLEWLDVAAGQVVCAEHEEPRGLFIVVEGGLDALAVEPGARPLAISRVTRGDCLGEFSLLMPAPSPVRYVAFARSKLILVSKALFDALTATRPEIRVSLVRTLIARQWHLASFILERVLRVWSVPSLARADQPGASVGSGAASLDSSPALAPAARPLTAASAAAADASAAAPAAPAQPPASPPLTPARLPASGSMPVLRAPPDVSGFADAPLPPLPPAASQPAQPSSPQPPQVSESQQGPHPWLHVDAASGALRRVDPCVGLAVDDATFLRLRASDLVRGLTAGEALLQRGATSKVVYVVVRGSLAVEWPGGGGAYVFGERSVVGALSCLTQLAMPYTVRAVSAATVAWFDPAEFAARPTPSSQQLALQVARAVQPCVREFVELGFQRVFKNAGSVLFRAGEPADHLYVVVSGRVASLSRRRSARQQPEFEIGVGECVGEFSFFANERVHSHSVVCVRDTELVQLSRAACSRLFRRYPHAMLRFTQAMAERVRRSLDAASRPRSVVVRTITVLKGSESVALGGFLSDLVTELRRLGDVMHVSEALVNAELGEGATRMADYSSKAQIMRWLAEKEETHRLIVFEADAANALWARMCVKSADRVLVVCSSADAPVVPALEYELLWSAQARNNLAHRELVLLHAAGTALPSRTLQWLQARDVEFHHHVRLGHAPHYARLARQLVGQTLGLVLSGGGARGLAHLGAIRAMEERGIAVDYVGGTSQGAFMAAVFAINETYEASAVATRRLATRMGNMWDLLGDATLPVMAYFSGKSLNKTIREILGAETQVEDLWVPFFCVSTNLSCADMYVHTRGPLWRAVRASMSILDYLPPVHDGKDLLCDGGYLANLPADVMRDQFHPQQIIAVDVENKDGDMITNVTDFGDHLSGFWLLAKKIWHSLSPCASKFNIPRFAELISALNYINHNRSIRTFAESKLIDIYVRPELQGYQLLDYHKMDEIAEAGYRKTRVKLSEWLVQHGRRPPVRRARGSTRLLSLSLEKIQRKPAAAALLSPATDYDGSDLSSGVEMKHPGTPGYVDAPGSVGRESVFRRAGQHLRSRFKW